MKRDFDIIEYPFEVDKCHPPSFVKINAGYETRVCDRPDSKKVSAVRSKRRGSYLHIEVSENDCKIIGYTKNMYNFTMLADFYLPIPLETRGFYEELYSKLVYGDLNLCIEAAEAFEKTYRNAEVPKCPVPVISVIGGFENYNLKGFKSEKDELGNTVHVRYEESIPQGPTLEVLRKMEKLYGAEVLRIQRENINRIFSIHPILRISAIVKLLKSGMGADTKLDGWRIRKFLPACAYFITSGPWRSCWARFGTDPKLDPTNFKYQIYDSRRTGTVFQVFEVEDVLYEIERNKSWYLTNKLNMRTGFHTKALLNLLKFRSELEFNVGEDVTEEDVLEFEVFD